jgi:hypothetical protein
MIVSICNGVIFFSRLGSTHMAQAGNDLTDMYRSIAYIAHTFTPRQLPHQRQSFQDSNPKHHTITDPLDRQYFNTRHDPTRAVSRWIFNLLHMGTGIAWTIKALCDVLDIQPQRDWIVKHNEAGYLATSWGVREVRPQSRSGRISFMLHDTSINRNNPPPVANVNHITFTLPQDFTTLQNMLGIQSWMTPIANLPNDFRTMQPGPGLRRAFFRTGGLPFHVTLGVNGASFYFACGWRYTPDQQLSTAEIRNIEDTASRTYYTMWCQKPNLFTLLTRYLTYEFPTEDVRRIASRAYLNPMYGVIFGAHLDYVNTALDATFTAYDTKNPTKTHVEVSTWFTTNWTQGSTMVQQGRVIRFMFMLMACGHTQETGYMLSCFESYYTKNLSILMRAFPTQEEDRYLKATWLGEDTRGLKKPTKPDMESRALAMLTTLKSTLTSLETSICVLLRFLVTNTHMVGTHAGVTATIRKLFILINMHVDKFTDDWQFIKHSWVGSFGQNPNSTPSIGTSIGSTSKKVDGEATWRDMRQRIIEMFNINNSFKAYIANNHLNATTLRQFLDSATVQNYMNHATCTAHLQPQHISSMNAASRRAYHFPADTPFYI